MTTDAPRPDAQTSIGRHSGFTRASFTRAAFLRGAGATIGAAAFGGRLEAQTGAKMQTRAIPSSGAQLPVVGLGTWRGFDVGAGAAERAPLAQVIEMLFADGGTVIDSSPMYGPAEGVTGDLLEAAGTRDKAFLATKVWTRGKAQGIAQMEESFRRLRTRRIDLMQVHNLLDWRIHLATLRAWKAEGRIGYLGVTHYTASAYDDLEAVMRAETLDFVQFNYSIGDRQAERKLLPLAAERRIAVLVNLPFGGGGLLSSLRSRPLPGWAAEIGATSWAQVLLKFVLGHQAVTSVIPGTSRPEHMRDNARAGIGPMPDAALLKRMIADIKA